MNIFPFRTAATAKEQTARYNEWTKTTESGKEYAFKKSFYDYTISRLMEDAGMPPKVVIKRKWFPKRPIQKSENQRS